MLRLLPSVPRAEAAESSLLSLPKPHLPFIGLSPLLPRQQQSKVKNRGFITNSTCFHRDLLRKLHETKMEVSEENTRARPCASKRGLTHLQSSAAPTLLEGMVWVSVTKPPVCPHWTQELVSPATADLLAPLWRCSQPASSRAQQ